jgi:hypothetical protein
MPLNSRTTLEQQNEQSGDAAHSVILEPPGVGLENPMKDIAQLQKFSLLGGPLYRLGCGLGLVRGPNTVKLGLVVGILPWMVLLALALIDGLGHQFFTIRVIGAHVRLLVVIPLLFIAESALDPRMASFVDWTLRARAVAPRSRPALEVEIGRIGRWKDSWLLELACLAAALLAQPLAEQTGATSISIAFDSTHAIASQAVSGWWWWNVCLVLIRFLLLRWFVRLGLWTYFLWRVSRLELNLLPDHPDGVGGLGGLETVHRHFLPVIMAFSAVVASSYAAEISLNTKVFGQIYLVLLLMLGIVMVVFLGPVLVFAAKLKAARLKGARDFGSFAARYVKEFDRKWLGDPIAQEPLLGTPDLQSLADLANSVRIVRDMRIVPVSRSLLTTYVMGVVLPFLPLLLFKYHIAELVGMLFKRLSGL